MKRLAPVLLLLVAACFPRYTGHGTHDISELWRPLGIAAPYLEKEIVAVLGAPEKAEEKQLESGSSTITYTYAGGDLRVSVIAHRMGGTTTQFYVRPKAVAWLRGKQIDAPVLQVFDRVGAVEELYGRPAKDKDGFLTYPLNPADESKLLIANTATFQTDEGRCVHLQLNVEGARR